MSPESPSFKRWIGINESKIDNTIKLPDRISLFSQNTVLTLEDDEGIYRRNKYIVSFDFLKSVLPITEIGIEILGVFELTDPDLDIKQMQAYLNVTVKAYVGGKKRQTSYPAIVRESETKAIEKQVPYNSSSDDVMTDSPSLEFAVVSITKEDNRSTVILGPV